MWHSELNLRRYVPSRSGVVMLYGLILLTIFTGLGSLVVDFGHVELAKLEVQRSADAAARAAVMKLDGTLNQVANSHTAAIAAASMNLSDGQPLVLRDSDIIIGNYDSTLTPAFSASRLPLNGVQLTIVRDGTANPMVPLWLGSIVGISNCQVHATATAQITPPMSPYGIVGINQVTFGSVGVLAKINGDLVSNGAITVGTPLGLGVTATGNVKSFSGSVQWGSLASIGGSTTPLSSSLYYPVVSMPTTNNNSQISGYLNGSNDFVGAGIVNIPAGTYVVHDLDMLAGLSVNLQGPVTFYVTGTANIGVGVNLLGTPNTVAGNFIVKVAGGGSVNFVANVLTPMVMVVYAPQSPITIAVGVSNFTGMIVGQTLNVAAPLLSQYTEVKPAQLPPEIKMMK